MKLDRQSNQPSTSKRKALQNAFRAALAAIPLVVNPAQATDSKFRFASDAAKPANANVDRNKEAHTPRLKKLPEQIHQKKLSTPKSEDTDALTGFFDLKQKMRGMHLEFGGRPIQFKYYEEFCKAFEIFCNRFARRVEGEKNDTIFSPDLLARIVSVNREVNKKIAPKEDILKYGVEDLWTMPDDEGDCEDYVLLKMLRLIYAGIDPTALHILVVRDEKKAGHAVLGVDVFDPEKKVWNTLVLDNKHSNIITLDEMERKYEGHLATFVVRTGLDTFKAEFFEYRSKNR